MKRQGVRVPRRTISLFSLFCSKDFSDPVQGDCEELFRFVLEKRGPVRATLWLWLQIVKSFPPFLMNHVEWFLIQGANYMKIASRNMVRNRMYSLISIVGLALAVSCFTLPFLYVHSNYQIDRFHEHADEIFYVENRLGKSGGGELWGPTPLPLGPALKRNFPQILDYVRVNREGASIRIQDKIFKEVVYLVDPGFLELFTFPMIAGDRDTLKNRKGVIITDRCAEKYFDNVNPIGKELWIIKEDKFIESFEIGGVVKKPPVLSSLQFDILVPHELLPAWKGIDPNDWGSWTHTFVRLRKRGDVAGLYDQSLETFIRYQNQAEKSWPVLSFLFEPFVELSGHSDRVNGDIGWGFPTAAIIGLSFGGIMIFVLGCFSYINIGIVTGGRRLREIGIRKVLGSSRSNLVIQFLGEHAVVCLAAVLLGAFFTEGVVLPFFNSLFHPPLTLDLLHNHTLWVFYGLTVLITVLASGGYPALYVSRFKPVHIFKRTRRVGGGSRIINLFLSLQFILTFVMIGVSLIFIQNATYQKNIDWGYNQQQVINIPVNGRTQFEMYRNTIAQNPDIMSGSGARNPIGTPGEMTVVWHNGEENRIPGFEIGPEYLRTLEVRFKTGRAFRGDQAGDDHSIIVNEKFARTMGWKKAVGKRVSIDDRVFAVIGVVEDFFNQPFKEPIQPVFFRLCEPEAFRILSVRVRTGKVARTVDFLEQSWKRLFPFQVYEGFFQDDVWSWIFRENTGIYKATGFIALTAMVISCMGLFGLISLSITRRLKEISIRKVVGASMANIVKLLNRNIFKIVLISSMIAVPLCYVLMNWYLDFCYAYRTPITVWPFLAAALVMVVSSLLSVSSQIIKGARVNMVDFLKEE